MRRIAAFVLALAFALPAYAQEGAQTILHLLDYVGADYGGDAGSGERTLPVDQVGSDLWDDGIVDCGCLSVAGGFQRASRIDRATGTVRDANHRRGRP